MRCWKPLLLFVALFSSSAISYGSLTPYPVGITDTGIVVLTSVSPLCPLGPYGFASSPCYSVQSVFSSGPSYISASLPDLAFDNGTTCMGLPSGADTPLSRCNAGFYIFSDPNSPDGRVFDGFGIYSPIPDPRFRAASIDAVVLNSLGQFAFASGAEELVHFGSVLTPEPATFALLGTGLLSALGLLRKRLF